MLRSQWRDCCPVFVLSESSYNMPHFLRQAGSVRYEPSAAGYPSLPQVALCRRWRSYKPSSVCGG
jgi:hypothetical protein